MNKYMKLPYLALILKALGYLSVDCRLEKFSSRMKFWRSAVKMPTSVGKEIVVGRNHNDNFTFHDDTGSSFGVPITNMKHEFSSEKLNRSISDFPLSYNSNAAKRIRDHDHQSDQSFTSINSITGAILVALQESITLERCRKVVYWFGAYWLMKKILKEMSTILDEVIQEDMIREDHDNLLFKPETVAQASASIINLPILNVRNGDNREEAPRGPQEKGHQNMSVGKESNKKSKKTPHDPRRSKVPITAPRHLTHKIQYARDLILKLHAAGLPLQSQMASENGLQPPTNEKTAESVLRTLTKVEGSLLSNCLLIPEKVDVDGNATTKIDPMEEWNKIGGLVDVKEALLDLVVPLTTSPKQNQKINGFDDLLAHPSGLLLYGPPGCGKTLLAKSLAFTAGARFLCVKHSDLQRKYYGETNLRVRGLFSLARKIQPCIIFVDEVDGLFRERYSGGSGGEEHDASRDLKTEFMQLWDGISSKTSDKILVMGATNRPFDVDAAFLRRMPRSYFVGLPDLSARIYILQNLLQGVPLSPDFDIGRQIIVGILVSTVHFPFTSHICHLFSNFSPEMIACQTQGYSPSDLKELLRVAVLAPLREARVKSLSAKLSMGLPVPTPQIRPLQPSDVTKARRIVTPTQYSAAYRSAIADYVSRYQGSLNAASEDSSNKECIDSEEEEISEPFSEDEGMSSFDDD